MNSVKKLFLFVVLMAMSGVYALAQTTGMKIGAIHPDLKVKMTRCEAAGRTVVIDLVFENVGGNDVDFRIWGGDNNRSVAYDDEGNVFNNLRVKVGNSDMSTWYVKQILPAGVPLKGRIQIEGVPESSTVFRRIDLHVESEAWNLDKKIKISNVPISREGDE